MLVMNFFFVGYIVGFGYILADPNDFCQLVAI